MSGEGSSLSVPAAFGRFRVLHQIGAGSHGPVFRGEDSADGRAVAIKVLQLDLPPERAHEVADDLHALQERLPAHNALAAMLATGLHEVYPYIVSALAPGQSLDVALRDFGPAVISDALPRLTALAGALDLAGESWSWHGNLHPRDVVIDESETVIIGAGIAPIIERAGVRLSRQRPYAAPEAVDGKSSSPATDQYALAAMAYEWLFGRRAPGPADEPLQTPALPGVDRDAISAAFTSALAADPAARFDSCSAFVTALGKTVNDPDAAAAAPDAPRRERRRSVPILPLLDDTLKPGFPAASPDKPAKTPARPAPPDESSTDELVLLLDAPPTPVPDTAAGLASGAPAERFTAPPVVPLPEESRPRFASEPVAWQGSLGAAPPTPAVAPKRGFGFLALIAALLLGIAGGIGGTYAFWRSNLAGAADTVDGRPFTDASVESQAAGSSDAAPVPPPPADSSAAAETPSAVDPGAGAVPASRTEPPPPASTAESAPSAGGRLLVRSSPSGADVVINGIHKGVTPLTLRDLPLGTHTVVVTRSGYARSEQRVALTRSRPSRSVDARLIVESSGGSDQPSAAARPEGAARAAAGSLTVDSRPAGSLVTIDGREVGTTPLTLDDVTPGQHTVTIMRDGYRPWTTTIIVEAGQHARVAASLGTIE